LADKRVRTAGNDRQALLLWARASARLGRHPEARSTYARLGKSNLGAEDYFLIGLGWSRTGRPDAAMSAWNSALDANPNHAETLNDMARLGMHQKHPIEAARAAERLSQQPGWEARGCLLLGMIRAADNDPLGAADALRRALRLDPAVQLAVSDPQSTLKLLVRMLLQSGRTGEAVEALRSMIDAKSDVEAYWLLSRAELQRGDRAAAAAALGRSGGYRGAHPIEAEPAYHVGEARCAECHRDIYRDAQASAHSRTFRRVDQLGNLPLPDQSLADPDEPRVSHKLERVNGRLQLETRVGDRVYRAIADYALGSMDRYQTLVGHDEEGKVRVLRLSYYKGGGGSGWDRTKDQPSRPAKAEDFQGKPFDTADGTNECLTCHATTARSARLGQGPEAADHAIGCEGCHGPGALHLAAEAAQFKDPAIISPPRESPAAINKLCGHCHSQNLLEMPVSMADTAWARFPGSTMPQSRCYTESGGRLNCVDCHDPHRPAESSARHYEKACLSCHSTTSASKQSTVSVRELRSPCPVSPTRDCLQCHMPKVPDTRLHNSFTDHYIRVHDPKVRVRTDKPQTAAGIGDPRAAR
jgi:tetratricopeptide (TPR) repeat protein